MGNYILFVAVSTVLILFVLTRNILGLMVIGLPLVIIISGIRYTLDPAPVRRGGHDWMSEGMWVRATFDRDTRVIYDIGPTQDPMQ